MNLPSVLRNRKFLIVLGLVLAATLALIIQSSGPSSTAALTSGPMIQAVYGMGTVTSENVFRLKVGVSSEIRTLEVKEGDIVTKGQLLLITGENQSFRAPFDGTITSLPYHIGEAIFPQIPILTLMDLKQLYLVVSLEQQGALKVRKGQNARISFDTLKGKQLDGRVSAVYPQDDQFLVRIDIPGLPPEVLPGMTADVAIEISKKDSALRVPVSAIQSGKIHVKRGPRYESIAVQVGLIDGQWAEILGPAVQAAGLQAGDLVLIPKP